MPLLTRLSEILSDPTSGLTVRRTSALLVMISIITTFASQHRVATFGNLCAVNALIAFGLALALRERFFGPQLNRWDEVLTFGTFFLGARAINAVADTP